MNYPLLTWLVVVSVVAVVAFVVASDKGRSDIEWAVACALLPAAILILIALPTLKPPQRSSGTKACPQCAENVNVAAKICRYCRYEFPVTEMLEAQSNRVGSDAFGRGVDRKSPVASALVLIVIGLCLLTALGIVLSIVGVIINA
jgi:Uncharacterised protein family UPF0547